MNVLALYDIHGNVDALEAVLAAAPEPDLVLVGGDAVPGPFAAATLDRLAELPTRWVRGNGERETAAALDDPEPAPDDVAAVTAKLSANELGAARARPLGELALTTEVDGVLYCHATPRDDAVILTRLSPDERYAQALEGVTHSIVVAGHTHQQHDRTVGGTRFLNAGSVGLPYEGDGAARWLWVADGVPALRSTPYDAAAAGTRMKQIWPGRPVDRRGPHRRRSPALEITEFFEQRAQPAT